MARIRYIKPEIGTDEDLAKVSIWARFLFALLPTHCDREGRMEDKPRHLKLFTFPWDDVDVDALLNELSPRFVVRYKVAGKDYLHVRGFAKHQRPHPNEQKSELPVPKTTNINLHDKKCKLHDKKCKEIARNDIMSIKGTGTGTLMGTGTYMAASPQVIDIVKKETPIQAVVRAYKHAKGVEMADKGWDKNNFPRAAKAAKNLLDCFGGDVEKCAAYIFVRSGDLNEKRLEWTLETIARHAWDKMGMEQGEDKNGSEREPLGSDRLAGRGTTRRLASAGDLVSDALRGIEQAAICSKRDGDMASDGDDHPRDK